MLQNYFDELSTHQLLTPEQEQQLSARALGGDQRAQNRLVEANLRLVPYVAREYQNRGLALDDLISEGNVALVHAAARYDASRGLRFASYAAHHIRRAMEQALQREQQQTKAESRASGMRRSLDAPLGAKPNVSLLSVLINADAPLADSRAYSAAQERQVQRALNSLGQREMQVISAYFGLGQEPLTMAEIASDMGLRRERVRQIRDRAVRRMRKAYKH